MTGANEFRSGKTHRDENFPVASWLIRPRHRALILAFYEFVRSADDIADHASLAAQQKVAMLDRMEADLLGASDDSPEAATLRRALAERNMSPQHAQDLLKAFRLDATKLRYRDWDDLMGYCAYSAMPVGRFVLDVHGESRATWPASDATCAALQIINHLQDCAADYRNLDRVYIPLDALAACGLGVEALAAPKASPELRRCLAGLAKRTAVLLHQGDALPSLIEDGRLALEISVIQTLAQQLTGILLRRDPLSERVHLGKLGVAGVSLLAIVKGLTRRAGFSMPDLGGPTVTDEPAAEAEQRASGSSFYLAMRIMPKEQREAMFEIYSFCRKVDDIADEAGPRDVRLDQLQRWRNDIDALYGGTPPPPLRGLASVVRDFDLQREDFLAIIDGMEMDVVADIRAPTLATFDVYCDRVASAVGRLSVRVFGMETQAGIALAHHLGRALQITNILRDLDEDAAIGRLYLPREVLADAGITTTDNPAAALASPTIGQACAPVAARAERHFAEANAIMAKCPRRTVRTPRVMAVAYRMILNRLMARGWQPPRQPVRLRRSQFLWIFLRHAIL